VLAIALEFIGAVLVESGASINALAKEEDADVMPAASRIAPVLRRALPAIRIVSKWILSHAELLRGASDFWPKYVDFINAVSAAFQQGNLPDLPVETILEENIDMAGFLPVSQMLRTAAPSSAVTGVSVVNAAHPNEEHLMRVADVLADAALLASNVVRDEKVLCLKLDHHVPTVLTRRARKRPLRRPRRLGLEPGHGVFLAFCLAIRSI
jgi:hypothetical protein